MMSSTPPSVSLVPLILNGEITEAEGDWIADYLAKERRPVPMRPSDLLALFRELIPQAREATGADLTGANG